MAESLTDNRELLYGTPLRERLKSALRETPWWAISVVVHFVLIVIVAPMMTWQFKVPETQVEIQTKIEEKVELPAVVLDLPKPVEQEIKRTDKRVTTERKVSLQQKNLPQLENILKPGNPNTPNTLAVLAAPGGVIRVGRIGEGEGLHVGGGGIGEGLDDTGGWPGWKGRCIAVWLFDESKSMKPHQQIVRQKVDELYESLGIVGGGVAENKRIVTAVCSYGKDFHVLLKDPTADMAKVRDAIDKVPVDESGAENYLAAVNGVLNEFSGYAKKYSRNIVIVIVTDEAGDDDAPPKEGPSPLEVTVDRLKKRWGAENKLSASVLAFGYEAGAFGYGRELTYDPSVPKGTDPYAWVNRGIESAFSEMIGHDYYFRNVERVPSGFGPYGLSRLCHETGGVYYLMRQSGATSYDYEKLLKGYQPELENRAEVAARNAKNNARKLIMMIPGAWGAIGWREDRKFDPYYWNNEGGRKQMETTLKIVDEWLALINDAIKRMSELANVSFADTPSARRWEANRDLMWAQLHKHRFELIQLRLTMQDLQSGKNIPPPGDIGWHIGLDGGVLRGDMEKVKEEIGNVRALFQEVVDRHAGTPWEVYARGEMNSLHGFAIRPHSRSGGAAIKTESR